MGKYCENTEHVVAAAAVFVVVVVIVDVVVVVVLLFVVAAVAVAAVVIVVTVVVGGGVVVLVSSRLVLSCPCLILSCLLFVSSSGSCRVIFGRLGGLLGSFLLVLGVVLDILDGLGASF